MKLHYVIYGEGPRQLVILHGMLGSERNWHTVARRLSNKFRLIVPDQRNHGVSPHHPEHSIEAMRQDLEELIESLQLESFCLLGHSMGGHVAMNYAFLHPKRVRALVIEDIAPRSYDTSLVGIIDAMSALDLSQFKAKKEVEKALKAGIENPDVRNFVITNLVRDHDHLRWRINLDALRQFAAQEVVRFKADPAWKYDGPTLFIGGAKSAYKVSDERNLILEHFPKAQIAMVKNAGHWVHHEATDSFCRLVSGFLETR